jgi:hypothetical protein
LVIISGNDEENTDLSDFASEAYGILASTDPVALDQVCIDIINQQKVTAKNEKELQ